MNGVPMPSQATRPPLVGMPAVWLRDNCPCPLCRDPVSGRRLLHITDIPADIAVAEVARSAGTIGRLFDVRVESSPSSLAFTSLPIPPHTDNPYRDPVPTVQLLHCLHNAAEGGDSGFVDGFHAAAAPSMLTVRLRPGDCAVFDNTRVLHARTGFAQGGRRHLQGCYADLDGVESAVAVGERATTGVTCRKDRI
jgi:hypothetical protein